MKLKCIKCNKVLTKDMYPVKVKWDSYGYGLINNLKDTHNKDEPVFDYDAEGYEGEEVSSYRYGSMKSGLFYMSRPREKENYRWDDNTHPHIIREIKSSIVVGEQSLIEGVIPPFKQGYGCCNYNMGSTLSCSCGNILGGLYLDCFEDKSVQFTVKSVRRVYIK